MAARPSTICSCSRCDCFLDSERELSTCLRCPDGRALCAACSSRHRRLFPSHCTEERCPPAPAEGLLPQQDIIASVAPREVRGARLPVEDSKVHGGVVPATPSKDCPNAAYAESLAAPLLHPSRFYDLMPEPVAKELDHVWEYNGAGSCANLDADGVLALRTAASHWMLALAPGRYGGDGQELSDWVRHRTCVDEEIRSVMEARFRGGGSIFFTCDPAPMWTCAVAWDGRAVAGVLVGSDYGYAVWGGEGWICSHGENDYRPFDPATVDPPTAAAAMRYALQSMLQWADDRSDE